MSVRIRFTQINIGKENTEWMTKFTSKKDAELYLALEYFKIKKNTTGNTFYSKITDHDGIIIAVIESKLN